MHLTSFSEYARTLPLNQNVSVHARGVRYSPSSCRLPMTVLGQTKLQPWSAIHSMDIATGLRGEAQYACLRPYYALWAQPSENLARSTCVTRSRRSPKVVFLSVLQPSLLAATPATRVRWV